MREISENIKGYEKLTPEQQMIVDMVYGNLSGGSGIWKQGWKGGEAPESIRGSKYKGMNNLALCLVAMSRGYSDNRWVTFHQMTEREWKFKTNEEGKSLGKNAGVSVEYFELRDRNTKKPFDRNTLLGLDMDEKEEYIQENVYPIRKFYRVFNGDIIDGMPEKEKIPVDETAKNDRAESILKVWSDSEARIIYGGSRAYYSVANDEIRVPERNAFYNLQEFYGTTLHEIGHSTGHEKRLKREIQNNFGSTKYALEELRAEIASMFISQNLGLQMTESHLQNNSAYIKSWLEEIKENPNALFTAIADADKISRFVMSKEQQKTIEPFAIVEGENEFGDKNYSVQMISAHGQTKTFINYVFSSREALMSEFEKMQKFPFWADKAFKEVSLDELQAKSLEKAEATEVAEEKSEEYVKPSEYVANAFLKMETVNMTDRGVESLTKMSDRDLVERAAKTKNGDKFTALYKGNAVLESDEKDERSLMSRIAMYCNGDKEQLMRVFKSSGQFRDEKPNSFYEKIATESMAFVDRIRREKKSNIALQSCKKTVQNTKG